MNSILSNKQLSSRHKFKQTYISFAIDSFAQNLLENHVNNNKQMEGKLKKHKFTCTSELLFVFLFYFDF